MHQKKEASRKMRRKHAKTKKFWLLFCLFLNGILQASLLILSGVSKPSVSLSSDRNETISFKIKEAKWITIKMPALCTVGGHFHASFLSLFLTS